jgi:hypothetical protein
LIDNNNLDRPTAFLASAILYLPVASLQCGGCMLPSFFYTSREGDFFERLFSALEIAGNIILSE